MKRMSFTGLILAMASAGAVSACANPAEAADPASGRQVSDRDVPAMKVRMTVEGRALTATLVDNATSRDFVSLLPLTLTLRDYESTEKIRELPRKLSTKDAPAGIDPVIGDITYYSPWGNLAIFYRDFGYSSGLTRSSGTPPPPTPPLAASRPIAWVCACFPV